MAASPNLTTAPTTAPPTAFTHSIPPHTSPLTSASLSSDEDLSPSLCRTFSGRRVRQRVLPNVGHPPSPTAPLRPLPTTSARSPATPGPELTPAECAQCIYDRSLTDGLIGLRIRKNFPGSGPFDGEVTGTAPQHADGLQLSEVTWSDGDRSEETYMAVMGMHQDYLAASAPPGSVALLPELRRTALPTVAAAPTTLPSELVLPVPCSFHAYPLTVDYNGGLRKALFKNYVCTTSNQRVWRVHICDPSSSTPVVMEYGHVEVNNLFEYNRVHNNIRKPPTAVPTLPIVSCPLVTLVTGTRDANGGLWTTDCATVGELVSARPRIVEAAAALGAAAHRSPPRKKPALIETFTVAARRTTSTASTSHRSSGHSLKRT